MTVRRAMGPALLVVAVTLLAPERAVSQAHQAKLIITDVGSGKYA